MDLAVIDPSSENDPNRCGVLVWHHVLTYFPGLLLALLRDIAITSSVNLSSAAALASRFSESSILADFIASALPMIAFIFLLGGTEGTILLTWQPK